MMRVQIMILPSSKPLHNWKRISDIPEFQEIVVKAHLDSRPIDTNIVYICKRSVDLRELVTQLFTNKSFGVYDTKLKMGHVITSNPSMLQGSTRPFTSSSSERQTIGTYQNMYPTYNRMPAPLSQADLRRVMEDDTLLIFYSELSHIYATYCQLFEALELYKVDVSKISA